MTRDVKLSCNQPRVSHAFERQRSKKSDQQLNPFVRYLTNARLVRILVGRFVGRCALRHSHTFVPDRLIANRRRSSRDPRVAVANKKHRYVIVQLSCRLDEGGPGGNNDIVPTESILESFVGSLARDSMLIPQPRTKAN